MILHNFKYALLFCMAGVVPIMTYIELKLSFKNPPPYYLHESRNSNCIQNHITRGEEITERKKKDEEQKHGQETSWRVFINKFSIPYFFDSFGAHGYEKKYHVAFSQLLLSEKVNN